MLLASTDDLLLATNQWELGWGAYSVPHSADSLDPVLVGIDVRIYSIAIFLPTILAPGHYAHQVPLVCFLIFGHHGASRVTGTGVFSP